MTQFLQTSSRSTKFPFNNNNSVLIILLEYYPGLLELATLLLNPFTYQSIAQSLQIFRHDYVLILHTSFQWLSYILICFWYQTLRTNSLTTSLLLSFSLITPSFHINIRCRRGIYHPTHVVLIRFSGYLSLLGINHCLRSPTFDYFLLLSQLLSSPTHSCAYTSYSNPKQL